MPFIPPFNAYGTYGVTSGFPPLQRVIVERARGTIHGSTYGPTEIRAELESVAAAVESAYILTPKDELPKVTDTGFGTFSVDELGTLYPQGSRTAATARKRAAAWLAVAQHLEVEEKAKAYEDAKNKAVAESIAAAAKAKRLDELADLWFGKGFADLGPNKAAAVKEIYRLEQLTEDKDAL